MFVTVAELSQIHSFLLSCISHHMLSNRAPLSVQCLSSQRLAHCTRIWLSATREEIRASRNRYPYAFGTM